MTDLITRHIEELQEFASSHDARSRTEKLESLRLRTLELLKKIDIEKKPGSNDILVSSAQWTELTSKFEAIGGLIQKEQGFMNGLANHIDKVGLDTEAAISRQKLLNEEELKHDLSMKRQSRRSAVWQRIQTTVAIILIMMLTLLFATWLKLPVPRLIAPVTAGTPLTCKDEQEVNVDALRVLFGPTGVIAPAR